MQVITVFTYVSTLLGLVSSTPTPADLVPRCGTTIYPSIVQQISERRPNVVSPNNPSIAASQGFASGSATNRVDTLLGFTSIPASSYGCTLNIYVPPTVTVTTTGNPTLNISTIYADTPGAITAPNNWSWNRIIRRPGVVGSGLFGTVNVQKGARATINSQACPVGGGGLGYVVGVASWVSGSASIEFEQNAGSGFYLTYNC